MYQTPIHLTMKDAVAHMQEHGSDSQKQDIRKARVAFAVHGVEGPDFDRFSADLVAFETKIRKLSGTVPALQRQIHAIDITDNTYRQCWCAARRLIEAVTGSAEMRKERQSRTDAWSELASRVDLLTVDGLLHPRQSQALPALADACRAVGILPIGLNGAVAAAILKTTAGLHKKSFRNGLKLIDQLADIPDLKTILPSGKVTPPPQPVGRLAGLPPHMQAMINGWVDNAAREQIKDPDYQHLAKPLVSKSTFSSALSLYVMELIDLGEDLSEGFTLDALFEKGRVDSAIGRWGARKTHSAHTCYSYAIKLSNILKRNGYPTQGKYIAGLAAAVTYFQEGCAAGKTMSPKVKRWCESLLRDPRKTVLFQTQHIEYYRLAMEALATAKAAKIDLNTVSNPTSMAMLPEPERAKAKQLLERVRLFGLLAAYTAIALEGAPYRSINLLSVRHTGPNKTISLHLAGQNPSAVVKFPNEELKNGRWLSARGEELEAVTMEKRGSGDFGADILRFYLRAIRPLFPQADKTHCLFPPIQKARTTRSGFVAGTFGLWLAKGSSEIGLPLTSQNFRHGYCSIDINQGRRSMADLAKIIGDTMATVQTFYAWIDAKQSVMAVQQDAARRRAEIMKAQKVGRP